MSFEEIYNIIYSVLLFWILVYALILMFRVSIDMYISQKNIKTINKEIQRRLDEWEITEDELHKIECDVLMKK